ncbi:MAG TPA: MFS transporter [Candidatus Limnocylindria bacterium]|nr:MFS transporter [Candidatus Limnocylindria bacterium]
MGGTASFRRLWAGQTTSVFGTAVSALAVPTIAIVVLRAPAFWIGVLEAAQYAAFPVFGLVAGVWVDRWSRRTTMLTADVVRTLALASIPLAALAHVLGFAQLVAVALFVGIASVFFDVAYQAYVPALVAPAWLEHANARLEASNSAARLAGSGLAGVLIALVGAPLAVACDAMSYLVSVAALAGIRVPETHRDTVSASEPLAFAVALREGIALVVRSPVLRAILCATASVNFGSSIVDAVYLLFLYRVLHFSPALTGIVFACGNLGFLGALAAPALGRRFGAGPLLGISLIGSIVAAFAIPLALVVQPLAVILCVQILSAICIPLYNITQLSLRQRMVPADKLGRMNATMRTAVWGVMPLGALLGGTLGASIGIVPTLVVGTLAMGAAIPFVLAPVVRKLAAAPQGEAA